MLAALGRGDGRGGTRGDRRDVRGDRRGDGGTGLFFIVVSSSCSGCIVSDLEKPFFDARLTRSL